MANPSEEGPSGAGTEVLRRKSIHANSDAWAMLIDGDANHIYTVLSITWCEQGGLAETIGLKVDINAAGSNEVVILSTSTTLPANGTYVFSDKLVIAGTDELEAFSSAGNVDIYCSYIDQEFAA